MVETAKFSFFQRNRLEAEPSDLPSHLAVVAEPAYALEPASMAVLEPEPPTPAEAVPEPGLFTRSAPLAPVRPVLPAADARARRAGLRNLLRPSAPPTAPFPVDDKVPSAAAPNAPPPAPQEWIVPGPRAARPRAPDLNPPGLALPAQKAAKPKLWRPKAPEPTARAPDPAPAVPTQPIVPEAAAEPPRGPSEPAALLLRAEPLVFRGLDPMLQGRAPPVPPPAAAAEPVPSVPASAEPTPPEPEPIAAAELVSAATALSPAPEPGQLTAQPSAQSIPAPITEPPREHNYRLALPLDYQLLGLANPAVCTVRCSLSGGTAVLLSAARTGIYRPDLHAPDLHNPDLHTPDLHTPDLHAPERHTSDGHSGAPSNGLGYNQSPDRRTGLLAGTRVLTARGEIPVEHLVPGDAVLTLRGPALLPLLWIGRSTAEDPPVEITADAFGPGRPRQALRVGADHAIFMQTMPVAARELVNGSTVRSLPAEAQALFHLDVGASEVLLAEGIPLASGRR